MRDLHLVNRKKELQKNTVGAVYYIDEFCELCNNYSITNDDGFGYFLSNNGIESDKSVFNPTVTPEYAEQYNFIVWYNK